MGRKKSVSCARGVKSSEVLGIFGIGRGPLYLISKGEERNESSGD